MRNSFRHKINYLIHTPKSKWNSFGKMVWIYNTKERIRRNKARKQSRKSRVINQR